MPGMGDDTTKKTRALGQRPASSHSRRAPAQCATRPASRAQSSHSSSRSATVPLHSDACPPAAPAHSSSKPCPPPPHPSPRQVYY